MRPPAIWLYDGENNLADDFAGTDVRSVSVDGATGQIRERVRGGQTIIELLFHPAPGRRALLVSLGLSRDEVLAMADSVTPRATIGFDVGTLPAALRSISEGTLGNLSIDEQSQLDYTVDGVVGVVALSQVDSGRGMLEETLSSALLLSDAVDIRTVNGREAIALTTSGPGGRRVRILWPESLGWAELMLQGVPEDREAELLASIRAVSDAEYKADLASLPDPPSTSVVSPAP